MADMDLGKKKRLKVTELVPVEHETIIRISRFL